MFKMKNNHSSYYLADLLKLPLLKRLRSIYSHFSRYLPIVLMLNLQFLTGLLLWNSFPPNLISITFPLSFRKAFKKFLFKQFVAERF